MKTAMINLILLLFLAIPQFAPASELSDIIDKHLAALGGRNAVVALKSSQSFNTVTVMGLTGTAVTEFEMPAKVHQFVNLGVSTQEMGYDGIIGWSVDPNGFAREENPEGIKPLINEMFFQSFSYALPGRLPGNTVYTGDTVIADASYHMLEARPEGGSPLTIFINTENNLVEYRLEDMTGLKVISHYSDFREVGGLMTPFVGSIHSPNGPFAMEIVCDSVFDNIDIDDDVFRMPGESVDDFIFAGNVDSVVVPFSLNDGQIYIRVGVNGRGPFDFLLDTGANFSFLSSAVAGQLGLKAEGEVPVRAVGGYGQMGFGEIDSLTIGKLSLHLKRITIFDFDSFSLTGLADFGGILGYDFFTRFPLRIDFDNGLLVIYRPGNKKIKPAGKAISLDIFAQLPLLVGRLDGHDIRLLFDLGAQPALVVRETARAYPAIANRFNEPDSAVIIGGAGGAQSMLKARLGLLEMGQVKVKNPETLASSDFSGLPLPDYIEGIVGMGILKDFNIFLDYRYGKVYLERRQ